MSRSPHALGHGLSLAWRNLLRNWRRSLTTMLALTIGIVMLLLFGGFTNAIMATLETGIVGTTGHLHIQRQGFARYGFGNPSQYSVDNTGEIIALLSNDPELSSAVRVATPLLLFNGLISRYDTGASRMMSGEGVVPSDQRRLREWNGYKLQRAANDGFALQDHPANAAVVGVGLGRMLDYCKELAISGCPAQPAVEAASTGVGEQSLPADIGLLAADEARAPDSPDALGVAKVDLLSAAPGGAPNVVNAVVTAAENQGIGALDATYVALPIALARRLAFGSETAEQSTFIVVQLHRTADLMRIKQKLNGLFESRDWPLYASDFTEFFAEYNQVKLMFRTIFGFIAVLMSIIVLFTIANTMSASVMERTVEIGTLRALGVRARGVQRLFLLEGLLLGVIGVAAGVVLSLLAAALLNRSGLMWTPPNRVTEVPLLVSVWGDARLVLGSASVLLMVAMISSWVPARRAARSPIVDALRYV